MRVIRVVAALVVWVSVVVVAPVAVSPPDGVSRAGTPGLAVAEASVQPNFVVVVTDDQRFDTIGRCLPELDATDFAAGADACMPQFQERLMSQGTTFLKGEVTQSLCCPSRASILTGQYSTTTGVTRNDGSLLDDSSTIATWLHDAGYRTGLVGKYLNGYGQGNLSEYIPPGWDSFHAYHDDGTVRFDPYTDYPWIDWDAGDGDPVVTNYTDSDSTSGEACADDNFYSTDLMCNMSVDFLETDVIQPFFLYVAPIAPHIPNEPAERHAGTFDSVILPQYPDYNVIPVPNPPSYLPSDPINTKPETTFRSQLDLVLAVDDMIGVLHDQLAADGRLDDTVWVFISDNGVGHMEHRWSSKGCEYYVCHRVPFVMVCPTGICPNTEPGAIDTDNYALNIDIAPTIADLAGATPTLTVDGRSLVPILENPETPWRTEWFMYGHKPRYDGIVAVAADGNWYKYIELPTNGEFEMYNLANDPYEIANLAGNATHTAIETELANRLKAFLDDDPMPNVAPSASFTSSCVEADCDFTDTSTDTDGSLTSWDWDFGDGTTSTTQNPTHSYTTGGTYTVTLTVTDNNTDTDTTNNTVTVTVTEPPPNVAPSASFTSSCVEADCDFTDTSTDTDGSLTSWDWDFGDGTTSTTQNPTHSYTTGGTYTVTLTVTDNNTDTDTTNNTVTVTEPPDATTMHISDLDGSSITQSGGWIALVDVRVEDENGAPVPNATVTGSWNRGAVSTCETDTAGVCLIAFTTRKNKDTFTVEDVTHGAFTYASAENTDPDGDSDGTTIVVFRP